MNNEKYLSHRLRGFDNQDSSLKAIESAIKSNAPYLEIDTRVSKDGVIYTNHDDLIEGKIRSLSISKSYSSQIDTFIKKNNSTIIKLSLLLELFSKRVHKSQMLMIDIKDYGFEGQHLKLVQKYNLTDHISWVSWIPQTLLSMDKISPNTPKILSFVPVSDTFFKIIQNITIKKVPFMPIVLIGQNFYNKDLINNAHGYQHAYLCNQLNDELLHLLSKNGGGVCISKKFLTKTQLDFNKSHGLKTAVFSASDRQEYNKLSRQGVDIVFCDFIDQDILS